jgi:cadmium resistance protein CadD (predicted permease)
MQIFSYIFYIFTKVYRAGLDKKNPDIYACGLLTLLQGFNAYAILKPFFMKEYEYWLWIIIGVALFPVNMLLFNQKSMEKFDKRWDKESKGKRFFKCTLIIVYIIVSFALFLFPIR